MFSDLADSTALARALDAEDFRDLLNEYQATCSEVVGELGGHVAQYLGDGVMVYFGFPEAHEDDPRRATQAALKILDRTKSLNARLQLKLPFTPRVRIGIHTGRVVVGQVGAGRERLALGEAPNLAARLQQLAQPDAVVISEATRKLIEGYFQFESRGLATVKGFDEPVAVHEVLCSTGAQSRVEAGSPRFSPLVGREQEAAELANHWQTVLESRTLRTVVVSGEPGIGKSRHVQALKHGLASDCRLLEGYCSPLHQNAFLRPIAQALEACAGLNRVTEPDAKFRRLQDYANELGLDTEAPALLAPMLSIAVPQEFAMTLLAPALKRQRTMHALLSWIRALARRAPLMFVIEDLHWADPSTLELLTALIGSVDHEPILLLGTARPEFVAPWPTAAAVTLLLHRLPLETAEQVVRRVAQDRTLPKSVMGRIVELADGVPLYLEEVTKAILESDALRLSADQYELAGSLPEAVVPPTVQDSLMARLDRTGESKSVAQLAATLGREFSHDVLRAVALMDDATLNAGLRLLTDAGLIVAEEKALARVYRFKHALIQETAYQSLVKSRRQQYHHRVASVLRDQFPAIAESQPHLIALHHAKANLPELAATYFERAGNVALGAQAYAESISHFLSALEQLKRLSPGKERDSRELSALTGLGLPLLMTKGYAAADVEATYERALTLCTEVDPPVRVLFGIWGVQIARGDRASTERMAAQFERIAASSGSPSEKLISLAAVGSYAFWRGEFDKAITALQGAVDQFQPSMLLSLPRDYGYDNALYGHLYLAWAQYTAGRFDDGKATWDEVWLITEKANVPYLSVMTLSFGAAIARDVGEAEQALELSARGMALAAEHQLMFWFALAQMQHGAAKCLLGNLQEGMAIIEQGLGLFRAIGALTSLPGSLACLAEACVLAHDGEKGLAVVEEALDLTTKYVDQSCRGDLFRLKAELLLQIDPTDLRAESYFEQSIQLARAHGAGLWELRAAVSYARWLVSTRNRARALQVLDEAFERLSGAEPPLLLAARQLKLEIAGAEAATRDESPNPRAHV